MKAENVKIGQIVYLKKCESIWLLENPEAIMVGGAGGPFDDRSYNELELATLNLLGHPFVGVIVGVEDFGPDGISVQVDWNIPEGFDDVICHYYEPKHLGVFK